MKPAFNEYLWGDERSSSSILSLAERDFSGCLWRGNNLELLCWEERDLELWLDLAGNLDADVDFGQLKAIDLQRFNQAAREIFWWSFIQEA